ncbi:MAG: hydrogenase expression/formation protein HypE [Elusimicrobiota bacterium]
MRYDKISLAFGSGGRLTSELISGLFLKKFSNKILGELEDSAVLNIGKSRIAFTTDSYVVSPAFFPGGDIGRIAICGTVNDLSVKGARAVAVSCGLIIEEGFPMQTLEKIVSSMCVAAKEAGVIVATGDTKVVEKGKADGLFINTSGVGIIESNLNISQKRIRPGDAIIVSGELAAHGVAVMNARNNLGITGDIKSDCAPLNGLISSFIRKADVKSIRDITRGGLAMILNEAASSCGFSIEIDESLIPVSAPVKSACSMLGIDPVYVANEGKIAVFAPWNESNFIVKTMKKHKYGKGAAIIGKVLPEKAKKVYLRTPIGARRLLTMPEGEQLPRIC